LFKRKSFLIYNTYAYSFLAGTFFDYNLAKTKNNFRDAMIRIEEDEHSKSLVTIKLCGVLDVDCIPEIKNIFINHLNKNKIITIDLTDIIHISREGRAFLNEFSDRIIVPYV
jgi:hypothetical protein